MAKRGDGEIIEKAGGSDGVAPIAQTGMTVGASLTETLLPNQIKLATKTNSAEGADDELYAAFVRGDSAFIQSRMLSSGNMGEGAELLLIRTRQKQEEQNFIQTLLANAATVIVDAAKDKDKQRFYDERAVVAETDRRDQQVVEDRIRKQEDLFGGLLLGNTYTDRFGGTYDSFGYTFANGSYKTIAGDLFDMAKGIITAGDGQIAVAPGLLGVQDIGKIVMTAGQIVHAGKQDALNVANLLDVFENLGATTHQLETIAEGMKNHVRPNDPDVKDLISKIREMDGGTELLKSVFQDRNAFQLLQTVFNGIFSHNTAEASAVAEKVAPAAYSSFTDMVGSAGKKAMEGISSATAAVASSVGIPVAEKAADPAFQAVANAVEGGGLDMLRKAAPAVLLERGQVADYGDLMSALQGKVKGTKLEQNDVEQAVQQVNESNIDKIAQDKGLSDDKAKRLKEIALQRQRAMMAKNGREAHLKQSTQDAFNVVSTPPHFGSFAVHNILGADDKKDMTPAPKVQVADVAKKAAAMSMNKGR